MHKPFYIPGIEGLVNKNILFSGEEKKKIKYCIKAYITELSKKNHKIFLLDSFWSPEMYSRYQRSRYKKEIERRYHIKLTVEEFLKKDNVLTYMNEKGINIMKIKSVIGLMSAAELFPVIVSKINQDLKDERVNILINDFILKELDSNDFLSLYIQINCEQIKFFVYHNETEVIQSLRRVVDQRVPIS